jgi:hypothetical protein
MKIKLVFMIIICLALLSTCVFAIDMENECYTFGDPNAPYVITENPCDCLNLSTPKVDGWYCYKDGEGAYNEYANGETIQQGSYSRLYAKYVSGKGLYMCNDWYIPEEDPKDQCDAMNQFDWTDTKPSPDRYWRIIVHGNIEDFDNPMDAITVKTRINDGSSQWAEPENIDAWEAYIGYHDSVNSEAEHYIWELLIPSTIISSELRVGLFDPKSTTVGDCPTTEQAYVGTGLPSITNYGAAPTIVIDVVPPTPNPPTWSTVPTVVNSTTITMTATMAFDDNGVEYEFICCGGIGGHSSGWQNSRTYTDTNLTPNTTYTYYILVRDKSPKQNATCPGQHRSAKTPL